MKYAIFPEGPIAQYVGGFRRYGDYLAWLQSQKRLEQRFYTSDTAAKLHLPLERETL